MPSTGIQQLDTVLGGGVPSGDIFLVLGAAGTGKTTLCLQAAFHAAGEGLDTAFVTTFSESPAKLLGHASGFSFYDQELIEERVHLRNLYPLALEDLDQLKGALVEEVEEHDAKLLVLDGLASIRDLQGDEGEIRRFIYDLGSALSGLDAATLITSSFEGDGRHLPELTMADGVVRLAQGMHGTRSVRTLQVQKVRGQSPVVGVHSLAIDGDGIAVFPRLESMVEPGDRGLSSERLSTGLTTLDDLMDGGPPERSLTLVAGAPATGKTLLGLSFVARGLERDEGSVVVSFRENPQQLVDKAERVGVSLGEAVDDGRVRVLHRPPVDVDVDEVSLEIRDLIGETGADRVFIDTIDDLDRSIMDESRRRGFLAALASVLREAGATTLATVQVPQVAGPELDIGDSPIAAFAENVVLLRNVEYQGRLVRILSVVKMRDSAYDSGIRQYRVTAEGISALDPGATESGLLEGISQLPSEARVKREAPPEEDDSSE